MPPTTVHFNGGVNLADTETVMREVCARVPAGIRRIPDGETGERQQWVFFQLQKFWETPGLEDAGTLDNPAEGYEAMPKVRVAEGADPDAIAWPDLGYAEAYRESFATFLRLREEGVVPSGVRFQVQYPTPLASLATWVMPEDQDRLEPSYQRVLFADLDRLLATVPHDEIAVQWDVAVEFGLLERGFLTRDEQDFDYVTQRLVRCVDQVPDDVPTGLHLCYGDYKHSHFKEPESLELQVQVVNRVTSQTRRPLNWVSFTVPQYQHDPAYFAPLQGLRRGPETELYFALVPYHPEMQGSGVTGEQVRLVDENLAGRNGGSAPSAGWRGPNGRRCRACSTCTARSSRHTAPGGPRSRPDRGRRRWLCRAAVVDHDATGRHASSCSARSAGSPVVGCPVARTRSQPCTRISVSAGAAPRRRGPSPRGR